MHDNERSKVTHISLVSHHFLVVLLCSTKESLEELKMKLVFFVALVTVSIVGLTKAAPRWPPIGLPPDFPIDWHRDVEKASEQGTDDDTVWFLKLLQQQIMKQEEEEAEEESWCVCIRSPCPCSRPIPLSGLLG